MSLLSLQHISKRFDGLVAVDDVTCDVDRGQVVGFLGPNGAGKSTTMRMITQYFEPDSGTILFDGVPLATAGREAKRRIGFLPENNALYTDMLVSEYLDFIARLRELAGPGREFPTTDLGARVLGVQVTGAGADSASRGRLVLVGNTEFVGDRFVRAPENLAFALNAVDWLAQDPSLIAIRSVDRKPPALRFTSVAEREGVKYLNVIGIPLLVALYGVLRSTRRRARTKAPYLARTQPASPSAARAVA